MIAAAIMLLAPFLFPIWRIVLEAPQYPTPLGMDIHITKIVDMNPHDVKNINLMNHYVGMKNIPDHLPELDIFPVVIGVMAGLGFLVGLKGSYKWFFAWFVVMALLGCAGMYDFYLWEYDYGHTLSPKAIIKFTNPDGTPMAYQPPLIGSKKILNFTVHSYPRLGGVLVIVSVIISFLAALLARKSEKKV
jgi:copper chaperone NosL